MAYANGYDFRRKVTVDNTQVSGSTDHSNFPVLFSETISDLADTSNGGNVQSSSGDDIRFESTGGTKFDYEIDKYDNTTGELVAHVEVPTLNVDSDTEFYLYYGNSSVSTPEENPSGTWNSDYLSVFHLKDENANAIGEYGTPVLSDTIDGGHVNSFTFYKTYVDPVVIVFMGTFYGAQACGVRAKNVTSTGCDVFMQEPDNEPHTSERTYIMVMEKGQHTLPGGAQVEAGVESTNATHASGDAFGGVNVTFTSAFPSTPAVFHSLNTYNNSDFMETVAHDVTTSDFNIEQEAGASGSSSSTEDIAWIAIEPTVQDWFEVGISTASSKCGVDDGAHTISYTNGFDAQPNIIVKGNSGNGSDGYWARAANNYDGSASGNSSVDVYAEEDQVGDSEQSHAAETFAFMAFNKRRGYLYDSNDALTDSTGSHQVHLAGRPSFITGKIHEAVSLTSTSSGYDSFLDTQHAYTPDLNTTLTFSGWFRFDDLDNVYTLFGERGSATSGTRVTLLGDTAGDPIRFTMFGVASHDSADPGLTAVTWHHIAVTYDQSNVRFYVDGVEIDSAAETGSMNTSSNHAMFIGALDNIGKVSSSSKADIDEPRILKSAITGDWIATEYSNQNDPSAFYDVGAEYQESVTQDVTHTSDAKLRAEVDVTYTSDSKLRAEVDVTHTSDTKLRAEFDVIHTSDSKLRAEVDVTHTSDSKLRAAVDATYTSDGKLRGAFDVTHTSDAKLRVAVDVTHTSDSILKNEINVTHTSDGKLRAAIDVTHTSDSKLRGTFDVTYVSDAVLWVRRQHTSDAKLRGAFDITHTSDAYLGVVDYDIAPRPQIISDSVRSPDIVTPTNPDAYIGPQIEVSPTMIMPTGAYSDVVAYGGDDPEMDSPDYTMDDSSAIMGFSYEYGDRPSMADVGDTKPRMR